MTKELIKQRNYITKDGQCVQIVDDMSLKNQFYVINISDHTCRGRFNAEELEKVLDDFTPVGRDFKATVEIGMPKGAEGKAQDFSDIYDFSFLLQHGFHYLGHTESSMLEYQFALQRGAHKPPILAKSDDTIKYLGKNEWKIIY